jgi:hypothetical protein
VVAETVDVVKAVDVNIEVEVSVEVLVNVANVVAFDSLVTHDVLVCCNVSVTYESTCEVVVEVTRIVWVLVALTVDDEGALYTAKEVVPTIIRMPMASTPANGDTPFRAMFLGERTNVRRPGRLFPDLVSVPNS